MFALLVYVRGMSSEAPNRNHAVLEEVPSPERFPAAWRCPAPYGRVFFLFSFRFCFPGGRPPPQPARNSAVLPRHLAAFHPPRVPEGRSFLVIGPEKLLLLTTNGTVMTRDRFYSSAAVPCCYTRRAVCVICKTEKYVKVWKRKAANNTLNSQVKTSCFQGNRVWYLFRCKLLTFHYHFLLALWM